MQYLRVRWWIGCVFINFLNSKRLEFYEAETFKRNILYNVFQFWFSCAHRNRFSPHAHQHTLLYRSHYVRINAKVYIQQNKTTAICLCLHFLCGIWTYTQLILYNKTFCFRLDSMTTHQNSDIRFALAIEQSQSGWHNNTNGICIWGCK